MNSLSPPGEFLRVKNHLLTIDFIPGVLVAARWLGGPDYEWEIWSGSRTVMRGNVLYKAGYRYLRPIEEEPGRRVRSFMCQVAFEHELGSDVDGTRLFPTEQAHSDECSCAWVCGVVEVETRLVRVVKEGTL